MRSTMNGQSVTAKDIGREVGLSQPTVSRILAGATGYRVSPETRRRVLETAERMGYRPNAVARSLRRKRTNIVGFCSGYGYLDARNAFVAEILGGLQRSADVHCLDILLHGVFRGGSTDDIYGELVDGRVDGLLLHTFPEHPLVAKLQASSLPVVAVADSVPGIPSVVSDDDAGTRELVSLLWERGHRHIAYLYPDRDFASVRTRRMAFETVMSERGADSEAAPVVTIHYEDAAPAVEKLRALPKIPTAVCCWNDLAAFNFIYACREQGIRVPEDMAVVGFDGLLDPRLTSRRLVTIATSWAEVTRCAMDLLVRQINRNNGTEANVEIPELIRMPVTLVPGDTV